MNHQNLFPFCIGKQTIQCGSMKWWFPQFDSSSYPLPGFLGFLDFLVGLGLVGLGLVGLGLLGPRGLHVSFFQSH